MRAARSLFDRYATRVSVIPNRLAVRAARALCVLGVIVAAQDVAAQAQQPATPPEHVHPAPPGEEGAAAQVHQHPTTAASLFSTREASGTAWLPDATPMNGLHRQVRGWEVMVHGNAFLQILHESAPEHRGADAGRQYQLGHGDGTTAVGRRMGRTADDDEPGVLDDPGMRLSESAPDRRDL